MIELLGWAATAVFVASYLCRRAETLTRVQMVGAMMWVCYGVLIGATPVIAANVLVFGAAAWALGVRSRQGADLAFPDRSEGTGSTESL